MSSLFKDTFRGLMIDQHFPDAPFITFSSFNALEQIERCKKAHVDSLHITTKCHWGYSYYPTVMGIMHPSLKGRDMVGELVSESRKAGIEAIAYYCFQFENLAARNHPDWRFITSEGKPAVLRELYAQYAPVRMAEENINMWRWDMPCVMTGYRQYCLDQIAEISSRYEFDGILLDIFGMGSNLFINVCYCPVCLRRYAEHGLNPYSQDTTMRFALIKHWLRNWATFLEDIRQVLLFNRPDMSLTVNGGPFVESWDLLKQVDWPYSEGAQNPFNSVVLRGLGLESPQCGISPGPKAYDAWSPNLARIWTSTVLAHGSRTFFFFMHGRLGDGTFEQSKYDIVEQVNEEAATIQTYVKGAEPLTATAVYHSEASWIEAGAHNDSARHENNIASVIDTFRATSIPCEFLPDWRTSAADLDRFQLIVLPEQRCLSDEEATALTGYVERGGHLLVTGPTGLLYNDAQCRSKFALTELLGIDYVGVCTDYHQQRVGGYMRFDNHSLFRNLPRKDYNMWGDFLKVRVRDAEVVARIAEPVGVETRDTYVGWRSLPPGPKAKWPCVTVSRRGKGTAIYSVAPLAQYIHDGERWPGLFIRGIAETIGLDWGLRWQGPPIASEATFFKKDGKLIVHVLNQSVRHNDGVIVPLRDCHIQCTDYEPVAATLVYPSQEELAINGRLIAVPPVSVHSILAITLPGEQS